MTIIRILKLSMPVFIMLSAVFRFDVTVYAQSGTVIDREAEDFDFANGLFSRGMYDMAANEYQNFIKKYPESDFLVAADYRTIECYFLEGKHEKALASIDLFIKKDVSEEYLTRAELMRGRIYISKREYEQAENVIADILSGDYVPDVTESAWYYYATVYSERKQYEKSKEILRDFLSKYDKGEYVVLAYLKLGDVFIQEGSYADAAENYAEALKRSSDERLSMESAFRAAGSYYKAGDYKNAVSFYEKAAGYGEHTEIFEKAMLGLISSLYKNREYSDVIERTDGSSEIIKSRAIKAQILFLKANSYFQEEKFDEASKIFSDIARRYPNTEFGKKSGLNECWALYESGKYEECISGIDGYMDSVSGLSGEALDEPLYVKGKALIGTGKKLEALAIYKELLAGGGDDTVLLKDVLYDAGWISKEMGVGEDASGYYRLFFEKYPDDKRSPEVLLKLGQWAFAAGKTKEAIDLYLKFISKFGNDPLMENVLFQLGSAYFRSGQYDKSIDAFERAISLFPDSVEIPGAQYAIAMNYQKKNEWDKAITGLEILLKDDRGKYYEKSMESAAYCYFQKEDLKAAADTYARLISERTDYLLPEGVYKWLSDFYFKGDQYGKSIEILGILLEKYPGSENEGETFYMLGENYAALEKDKEAVKYFDKAVSSRIGSPFMERSFLGLGRVYLRMGDFEKALSCLNQALENSHENMTGARARFEIGNVNFKMLRYAEAAKQYMMVAILYEDEELCPAALFKAGTAFDKAGDFRGAVEAFGELTEKYPENSLSEKAAGEIRRIEVETR